MRHSTKNKIQAYPTFGPTVLMLAGPSTTDVLAIFFLYRAG
jgi:hypothetical protein